jgi:hypothetical protein
VFLPDGVEGQNWDPLLQVLATRVRTEEVRLIGWGRPKLVGQFLQSIQLNPAIHTVKLKCAEVSALAGFLDAATSVTTLEVNRCNMEASELHQGVIDLAASIQRSTRIRKLILISLGDVYLCPILKSLAYNSHLKELVISLRTDQSHKASDALNHLLESTTSSIESFELGWVLAGREEFLRPIAQGLINSESVTDITFAGCILSLSGCSRLFKSILQSKPNIRSFCVHYCFVADGVLSLEDFIHVLQPDSSLRSLELNCIDFNLYGFTSSVEFKALLEAVEKKSNLESFSVGRITDEAMCQELVSSIPKMQLRTLQFYVDACLDGFKPSLLCAVRTNTSLYNVTGQKYLGGDTDLFNEEADLHKLKYYAERNKALSQWFVSSLVPREARPRALAAARVTGRGTVYRILQAMGNSVGPVEGQRKRKGPIRYTPAS